MPSGLQSFARLFDEPDDKRTPCRWTPDQVATKGITKNDWMPLILRWGPLITQAVLLVFQIYAYRRTSHYSLALLVVATVIGLVSAILGRVLYSEALYPSLRTGVYEATIILYAAYMVLGIWGAAALFRSYIRLTDANKVVTDPKLV
jgi:hypothetical protein